MDPAVSRAAFMTALILLGVLVVFVVGSSGLLETVMANPVLLSAGFLTFVFLLLVMYYRETGRHGRGRR
jgi:hypothetical protein